MSLVGLFLVLDMFASSFVRLPGIGYRKVACDTETSLCGVEALHVNSQRLEYRREVYVGGGGSVEKALRGCRPSCVKRTP